MPWIATGIFDASQSPQFLSTVAPLKRRLANANGWIDYLVFVTCDRTTPRTPWSALTDVQFIEQYGFGVSCARTWTAGSLRERVSGGSPKVVSNLETLRETGAAVLRDPDPAAVQ